MPRFPRRLIAALAPVLLAEPAVAAPAPAVRGDRRAPPARPPSSPETTVLCGSLADGATYLIEVPAHWNRTLFLYSHGYVVPGGNNPAQDVGDPVTGGWLLSHGFALAGSSYSSTGWAIQQALPDQIATLKRVRQRRSASRGERSPGGTRSAASSPPG